MENKKLIDANALEKYINENHSYSGLPMAAYICTMELLQYAPAVDAVEVVHGRLIPTIANVDCHCSVCRAEFDNILSKAVERWNYCPNCGACMDLEG